MALPTVRPFAPSMKCGGRVVSFLPIKVKREILAPVASGKGFGEPKKDQAKRPEAPQQQQGSPPAAATPSQATFSQAAPPTHSRVVRETPQVVVDRMFRRILIFTGLPVFTGMALYPLFYYLRVVQDIEYPLWIVYIAQLLTFGGGLAGITYGAMSASWDPSREGSALGWTELQANLSILLNRNKQE